MSEYEKEKLRIERQRNRIEVMKTLALPATILVTAVVAWLEITSANERSHRESTDRYELLLVQAVDNANDHCLMRDMLIALYDHHVDQQRPDPSYRWYINVKKVLAAKCAAEEASDKT